MDFARLWGAARLCARAVIAITAALTAMNVASAGAAPTTVGVNAHLLWQSVDQAELDRRLDLAQAAGARIVRVDVGWSTLQLRNRDSYSNDYLARLDALVYGSEARDLALMLTLSDSPCWASSAPADMKLDCEGAWWERDVQRYTPNDPEDYAAAMAFLVRRYGTRVAAWETWNEPNSSDYYRAGDPAADYVKLVKATHRAVKAADGSATLVAGAVMQSDHAFVERLYAEGIRGHFDALSIHPYSEDRSPLDPGLDEYIRMSFIRGVPAVREVMLRQGDHRPIWLTEFGWSTSTTRATPDLWRNGVDEEAQARHYEQAIAQLPRWPYVQAAMAYNLVDRGTDSSRLNDNYGLVRHDGTLKPAFHAFRVAVREMESAAQPGEPPTSAPDPAPAAGADPSPTPAYPSSNPAPSPSTTSSSPDAKPSPSARRATPSRTRARRTATRTIRKAATRRAAARRAAARNAARRVSTRKAFAREAAARRAAGRESAARRASARRAAAG